MTDQNCPDRICEGDEQIRKKYKKRCAAGEKFRAAQCFFEDIVNEGNCSKQAESLDDEELRT